jgi:tetratricopeptide (TPR) repeat protein
MMFRSLIMGLLPFLSLAWLTTGCASQHREYYRSGHRVIELVAWGKYAEAEALGRKTVADLERTNGANDGQTIAAVSDLALTLSARGDYVEAESLRRRVLAAFEAGTLRWVDAWRSVAIAIATGDLAIALRDQGKYTEAEAASRRAYATAGTWRTQEFGQIGERLPVLSQLLSVNLAATLALEGKYSEAESLYRSVVGQRESLSIVGWRSPAALAPGQAALQPACGLALVLAAEAQFGEAEALARSAATDLEGRLGPNHPQTLESISALARVLDAWGKYGEAEPMHRRVLAGFEREYGADHPLVARALFELAHNALKSGRPLEAEAALERSLGIRDRRLRPGHPDIADSRARLEEARRARSAE